MTRARLKTVPYVIRFIYNSRFQIKPFSLQRAFSTTQQRNVQPSRSLSLRYFRSRNHALQTPRYAYLFYLVQIVVPFRSHATIDLRRPKFVYPTKFRSYI